MAANYLPYEPQQMLLLPESLQEWLPDGHLAHFISDAIDGLDLAAFHARYDKDGPRNQPFHPAMMVKVLVYGYATGVFSSRKIARKLHEDVALRMLGASNFPAHRTIRDFRAFHLKELSDLFVQVVRLAREMGLVKLGTIAVDGTKVKANASRHKAMSYGHMLKAEAELKAQIEALLNKARATDEAEKNEPELDIPAEIARRQDRLDAIAAARARLEARQRDADLERGRSDGDDNKPRGPHGKPKRGAPYKQPFGVPQDKAQDNFTDPDSRIMQHAGGGFEASFNGQLAVDDTAHIIVAAELINNASDVRELPRMVEAVKDALGAYPEQTLADAGYRSEAVFEALAGRTELVVAIGREGKSHRPINEAVLPRTAQMVAKMQTPAARQAYRRRKWLAEPPNGWIKNVLGFRQFSMRGLHRVQAEWKLVCMALNLRRMATMQPA
ncbi:MAG: IS1182 family transposase [Pseudomonadota bacterium]|nr:IS1182 family transposase [Pseudomonadota bacterium]